MNGNSQPGVSRSFVRMAVIAVLCGSAAVGGKMTGMLPSDASKVLVGVAAFLGLIAAVGILGTARSPVRAPSRKQQEMRGIIEPFYATLYRKVKPQEDEQPWADDSPAAKTPEVHMLGDEPAAPVEFEFDARTATIVQDEESSYLDEAHQFIYDMKRYARSPEGEYFWMVLQVIGGTPQLTFIKHVPHRVARVALGKKYVAPAARIA